MNHTHERYYAFGLSHTWYFPYDEDCLEVGYNHVIPDNTYSLLHRTNYAVSGGFVLPCDMNTVILICNIFFFRD